VRLTIKGSLHFLFYRKV